MRPSRPVIFALAAAAAAFTALAPILDNGFVNWDDPGNILRNPWLGRFDASAWLWMWTTTLYGHFQPLAWLSLSLDRALWGLEPRGVHLSALLLHAGTAAALFSFLRRLLGLLAPQADARRCDAAALAAALLWAAHPLRVEAVAWATERREQLAALFVLLSLRSYLAALAAGRRPESGAALGWFSAACLSKVTAAALPAALLGLDRWVLGRGWRMREKAWFWLLGFGTVALGLRAQQLSGASVGLEQFGLGARLAQALYGPGYYALKTLLPAGLSPFVYVDSSREPERFAAGAAGTAAIVWLLARAARRRSGAKALALALAAGLLPSLGLFKSGPQTAADRFAHIPSLALAAALAWGLLQVPARWQGRAWLGCALAALALGAATRVQCRVWLDSVSLWSAAAAAAPPTPLVLQNLAAALREQGREAEASALYRRLSEADPDGPAALALAGDARYESGDFEQAARLYSAALEINADLPAVRRNLGLALYRLGRRREALEAFALATRQDPLDAKNWHDLGIALAAAGRLEEAETALQRALRLDPRHPGAAETLRKVRAYRRVR